MTGGVADVPFDDVYAALVGDPHAAAERRSLHVRMRKLHARIDHRDAHVSPLGDDERRDVGQHRSVQRRQRVRIETEHGARVAVDGTPEPQPTPVGRQRRTLIRRVEVAPASVPLVVALGAVVLVSVPLVAASGAVVLVSVPLVVALGAELDVDG